MYIYATLDLGEEGVWGGVYPELQTEIPSGCV